MECKLQEHLVDLKNLGQQHADGQHLLRFVDALAVGSWSAFVETAADVVAPGVAAVTVPVVSAALGTVLAFDHSVGFVDAVMPGLHLMRVPPDWMSLLSGVVAVLAALVDFSLPPQLPVFWQQHSGWICALPRRRHGK